MNSIIKAFILFIMIIHSESGRVQDMIRDKLDVTNNEPKGPTDNVYDDEINGNSFYDYNLEDMEIENSASEGTFVDRLKKLPAKVLISLYNSVNELKSGMGKIFHDRKLTEGAQQSLDAILGLIKDGFINAKDVAFG